MTDIYEDGTYASHNASWHEEDSPWKAGQIERIIRRNGLNPLAIGEVGCGAGEVLSQLARRLGGSRSFTGYDISPRALAICTEKSRDNLIFRSGSLPGPEDGPFDLIMAIDVIEHLEDYRGFLRALRGAGTHKIFHIPLDLSVQTVLRATPLVKWRKTVGHIHYFTKETALAALEDAGYAVIDHFYTAESLELPGRGRRAGLLRIPRKLLFSLNADLAVRILGGYSLMVLAK